MSQRPATLILPAHRHDDDHDDHGGLHRDLLATGGTVGRRRALMMAAKWGAGIGASLGALSLLGCGGDGVTGLTTDSGTSTGTSSGTSTTTSSTCPTKIPEETAGPYPGDSSNGPNVLNLTGVVRQDIRSSFAGLSGTAAGVPLTIEITLVSASTCVALANYAVYAWHCDRAGLYSLYSAGATNQNYLRGVQAADATGKLSFTSIFPGCYSGRWPHIHFEVYPSLTAATAVKNKVATSQIALPKSACDLVYATSGYQASVTNLGQISLATDNVFSDGAQLQLATVTGDVTNGFKAALTVAVSGT
jgi:protocatechuate 3,4-dioxygenase beta subunit